MTKSNTMQPLYNKIKQLGFNKKQVKKLLPDWWDDAIADTPAGLQQATLRFAKTFHLDYKSLLGDNTPEFRFQKHQFKHSKNLDKNKLQPAVAVAMLASRLTLSAFDKPFEPNHKDPLAIREYLLTQNPWIDFRVLATWCWDCGIPVIYLANLPTPKMDGLALQKQGRPVIILSKKVNYGALIFDLAHELGHILLGHVDDDSIVLDEKLSAQDDNDIEQQATAFALTLLTGQSNTQFKKTKEYSPNGLAQAMISKGERLFIDPLHICRNYAYSSGQFAYANKIIDIIASKLNVKKTDQQIAQDLYLDSISIEDIDDDEIVHYLIGV